jgi:hypothetical protein
MEVTLDRTDGVAFAFHLSVNGATLRGEDFGRKISITICQKTPWKFLELETWPKDVKATRSAVDLHFETNNGNVKVASFTLRYELDKVTVTNKFEDVTEVLGYEFISVNLPRLVTVREEDRTHGWFMAMLVAVLRCCEMQRQEPLLQTSSEEMFSAHCLSSCLVPQLRCVCRRPRHSWMTPHSQ